MIIFIIVLIARQRNSATPHDVGVSYSVNRNLLNKNLSPSMGLYPLW